MKKQENIILIVLFFSFINFLIGQNDTYQKAFTFPNSTFSLLDLKEISDDTIIISGTIWLDGIEFNPLVLTMDNTGNHLQTKYFDSESPQSSSTNFLYSASALSTNSIYTSLIEESVNANRLFLSKLDENGIPEWSSRLKTQGEIQGPASFKNAKISINSNENIRIAYESSESISHCIYDPEGNELNNQKIDIQTPLPPSENLKRYIDECIETENEGAIIAGLIRDEVTFQLESFFVLLNNINLVTKVLAFPDKDYELGGVFSNGDLLFYETQIGGFLEGSLDIVRVSIDGAIVWAKEFNFDESGKFTAKATITSEDEIIVASGSPNSSFCGIAKLDSNCEEVIWTKGHKGGIQNSSGLVLKVLDSGNIIYSSIISINSFSSYQLITKLNSEGELEGFKTLDFCINAPTDISVEIEERAFETSTFENDLFFPLNTSDFSITNEDEAINPIIPTPYFNFPSQLCITDCAGATGVNNTNAQTVTWTIENSTPATVEDLYPGQVCFDSPGTHIIRQTITFNNCEYSFEREVVVIAEPDFDLDSTQMLCAPNESLILSAQVLEPAQYTWSTGETISEIEIAETGTYSVTVSNELCEKEDEIIILDMSPEFSLPTQICIDNCITPTDLQNENAAIVEWYFAGAENEIITVKNPSQICFVEAGNHLVRQTITFGNCTEVYETNIFVFPKINLELEPNQTICNGEDIFVDATTLGADTYIWDNGNETASLLIKEPGTYILNASNGLCTASDTIIVNEILPNPYPISLPSDTIICEQKLPFTIVPTFASGENITWQDEEAQPDFVAMESGLYRATLDLDGCIFSAEMEIETEDCSDKIYIPNAFSPNNDGVNDLFRAEGRNFLLTQMIIYDRWGTLIYQSDEENAAWDGRFRGDFVADGVFVFVISYQNILLGERSVASGDVSVLK